MECSSGLGKLRSTRNPDKRGRELSQSLVFADFQATAHTEPRASVGRCQQINRARAMSESFSSVIERVLTHLAGYGAYIKCHRSTRLQVWWRFSFSFKGVKIKILPHLSNFIRVVEFDLSQCGFSESNVEPNQEDNHMARVWGSQLI